MPCTVMTPKVLYKSDSPSEIVGSAEILTFLTRDTSRVKVVLVLRTSLFLFAPTTSSTPHELDTQSSHNANKFTTIFWERFKFTSTNVSPLSFVSRWRTDWRRATETSDRSVSTTSESTTGPRSEEDYGSTDAVHISEIGSPPLVISTSPAKTPVESSEADPFHPDLHQCTGSDFETFEWFSGSATAKDQRFTIDLEGGTMDK
jgi:hypothetical protein